MQGPRFPSHREVSSPEEQGRGFSKRTTSSIRADSIRHKEESIVEVTESIEEKDKKAGIWGIIKRHGAFIGPGLISSIAYIDPGNFATDLQGGSQFGYSLLFIVLLSSLIALLFQLLATRLGVVSGVDLATHYRLALGNRPRHKKLYRWALLYPLYFIVECGIFLTDIAELLGSAIAINMLIPQIPLPACVALTSLDVLVILFLFDSYPSKILTPSMRAFEYGLGALVFIVLGAFVALLVKTEPVWGDVFRGFIPSPSLVQGSSLYVATGILGATVMPHAFFIGSKLASVHRLVTKEEAVAFAGKESTASVDRSLKNIKTHLAHASFDTAGCLLGFALVINAAILIVSAAAFYYSGDGPADGVADLFSAFDLMSTYLGRGFAIAFAIALLASATAASLTVTLSGQLVSEGFIDWKTTPWKRRAITRVLGLVPALAVSVSIGKEGVSAVLVGSQVGLSMVLPFVLAPLIIFTTDKSIMSVPLESTTELQKEAFIPDFPSPSGELDVELSSPSAISPTPFNLLNILKRLNPIRRRASPLGFESFANSMVIIYLAWSLWMLINIANVSALVSLGQTGP